MTKKHELHIGRIHADWCGHCVRLKGEWEKMRNHISHAMGRVFNHVSIQYHDFEDSEEQKKRGHHVDKELAKFNELHLPHSSQKAELKGGYPTLFRVLNGNLEYYEGERHLESMYNWFTNGLAKKGGKKRKRKTRAKGKKTKRRKLTRKTNLFRFFY